MVYQCCYGGVKCSGVKYSGGLGSNELWWCIIMIFNQCGGVSVWCGMKVGIA